MCVCVRERETVCVCVCVCVSCVVRRRVERCRVCGVRVATCVCVCVRVRKRVFRYIAGGRRALVAQRVSTITDADQILVLDDGCIIGRGTHAELLDTCPTYIEIVESQIGQGAVA